MISKLLQVKCISWFLCLLKRCIQINIILLFHSVLIISAKSVVNRIRFSSTMSNVDDPNSPTWFQGFFRYRVWDDSFPPFFNFKQFEWSLFVDFFLLVFLMNYEEHKCLSFTDLELSFYCSCNLVLLIRWWKLRSCVVKKLHTSIS